MTKRLTEPEQRAISRLVIEVGQRLLQHGAESKLVSDVSIRLGRALGLDSVELSLSASSLVVTTLSHGHCITTARRSPDRGINMKVVTDIQRTVILAEKGFLDALAVRKRLSRIKPFRYPPWLVVAMIGLSCAAFSRLAGGDAVVFALTFVASATGMRVRQLIAHRHFNPFLTFAVTAMVTTLLSSTGTIMGWGNEPFLIMASSVLMLVPGYPFINAVSDMMKGFVDMGIARWTMASLLTLATAMGIVGAMNLVDAWGWL